jgi:pseudaminic acid biosynthesis-associated methylase
MNSQAKLWTGKLGDDYTDRNAINDEQTQARCMYFSNVLNLIRVEGGDFPKEILEVGANQGQNIVALEHIIQAAGLKIKLDATEPNVKARGMLTKNATMTNIHTFDQLLPATMPIDSYSKELVFTSGVLIHVPTSELIPSMRELYRVSSRYILCMEYFSPVERSVTYHGEAEALWLRDYGSIYMDNFKLKLVGYGFCWKRVTKIDNVTWWLFEKVN